MREVPPCALLRDRERNGVLSPLEGALWLERGDLSPAREGITAGLVIAGAKEERAMLRHRSRGPQDPR
jgi:hypothetical protein